MRTPSDGEPGPEAPATLDYAGRLPRYRRPSSVAVASLLAAVLGPPLIALTDFIPGRSNSNVLFLFNLLVVAANIVLPIAAIVDVRLSRGSRTGIGLAILSPLVIAGWLAVGLFVLFYLSRR